MRCAGDDLKGADVCVCVCVCTRFFVNVQAGPSKTMTLDALSAVFHLPINDAAKEVRWCRQACGCVFARS